MSQELLSDLMRAKVAFQARTVAAVIGVPAESRMEPHELFRVPLATDQQLTDVELAAVRAGISLDWDHLRFEAQR